MQKGQKNIKRIFRVSWQPCVAVQPSSLAWTVGTSPGVIILVWDVVLIFSVWCCYEGLIHHCFVWIAQNWTFWTFWARTLMPRDWEMPGAPWRASLGLPTANLQRELKTRTSTCTTRSACRFCGHFRGELNGLMGAKDTSDIRFPTGPWGFVEVHILITCCLQCNLEKHCVRCIAPGVLTMLCRGWTGFTRMKPTSTSLGGKHGTPSLILGCQRVWCCYGRRSIFSVFLVCWWEISSLIHHRFVWLWAQQDLTLWTKVGYATDVVTSVAWSSDGQLAVGSADTKVYVYDQERVRSDFPCALWVCRILPGLLVHFFLPNCFHSSALQLLKLPSKCQTHFRVPCCCLTSFAHMKPAQTSSGVIWFLWASMMCVLRVLKCVRDRRRMISNIETCWHNLWSITGSFEYVRIALLLI